jgi:single-stranded DNA-binding protein
MPHLNHCSFIGHVGMPAKARTSKDGTKTWYELSVAVSTGTYDQRKTMWVKCLGFGKVGEKMAKNCNKGDSVLVSGRLDVSAYEKKQDGKPAANVSLMASEFVWLCHPTKLQNLEIPEFDLPSTNAGVSVDGLTDDNVPF